MANVNFTGVDISGQLIKTFNYNIAATGADTYSGYVAIPDGYVGVSMGHSWYPDTPGDKVYVNKLVITTSPNWEFVTEGSGTIQVHIRAIKGLEYYGQTLLNP